MTTTPSNVFLRLAAFYVAAFAVLGVYMQFFPLWLHDRRGLSATDVTFVLSGQIWARTLAGPVWALRVDRTGNPRRVLVWLVALSCVAMAAFHFAQTRTELLWCSVAFGCAYPPLHPILDGFALQTAQERGFPYTRVRMWGSLSFLLAIALAGAVLQYGSAAAAPVGFVLAFLVSGLVVSLVAAVQLPAASPSAGPGPVPRPGRLLLHVPFLLFLLAAGLISGSHAAYYSLSTLHWRSHGMGETTASLLWGEGIVAEIALFFAVRDAAGRLRPTTLMLLGAGAAVLRWSVLAATTATVPLLLVNWLHSVSFGCTYLGSMRFIRTRVAPELQATAQGLLGAAGSGVCTALATWGAGRLYAAAPGRAFVAMAALAAAGGLLTWRLRRR